MPWLTRLADRLWLWWHGDIISDVTPRDLMAMGLWEKAKQHCGTAHGQWVYDCGLASLEEPLLMTLEEARSIGYRPAHLEPRD
jgi:hypothetical protein